MILYYWSKYLLSFMLEYYLSPSHWCQALWLEGPFPVGGLCIPDTLMSDTGNVLLWLIKCEGGGGWCGTLLCRALWTRRFCTWFLYFYYKAAMCLIVVAPVAWVPEGRWSKAEVHAGMMVMQHEQEIICCKPLRTSGWPTMLLPGLKQRKYSKCLGEHLA